MLALLPNLNLYLLLFGLLGLVIGSYLNVAIYRIPAGISTVWPGSRCPRCLLPIRPYDNIPVLGWIFLGGRCRDCGVPISPRYPLVEAVTGLIFLACARHFMVPVQALIASLFGAMLLALALIDFDHRGLPMQITFGGMAFGLLAQPWWQQTSLWSAVVGIGVGASALFVPSQLWKWKYREAGFGDGDIHMAAMIGAFLGWKGVVVAIALGCGLGLVVVIAAWGLSRPVWPDAWRSPWQAQIRRGIPFGSFLALGAGMVMGGL